MPTFETPGAITVDLDLGAGRVRVAASDRADTAVDVHPSPGADADAALRTRVQFTDGVLVVKTPRGWPSFIGPGSRARRQAVDVTIALPSGSHIRGTAGMAPLDATGRLGECRYRTAAGDIQLDEAAGVDLQTGWGDVVVGRVDGDAHIKAAARVLRVGSVGGTAVVKSANGDTWLGECRGDVRVSAANGAVAVERAHAGVEARSANGDIRLGEIARGTVTVQTALGRIDLGVRDGVAVWLDAHTHFGSVRNDLEAAERPEPDQETVEVRARTGSGDITLRRSQEAGSGGTRVDGDALGGTHEACGRPSA